MDGSQGSQGSQGSCLSLSGWLYLLLARHCSWYYWSLISPRSSLSPVTWQQKRLPKSLAWRKFELEVSVSRDSLHEDYSHNFSSTGLTYQHGMVLPQLISSQPFNLINFSLSAVISYFPPQHTGLSVAEDRIQLLQKFLDCDLDAVIPSELVTESFECYYSSQS